MTSGSGGPLLEAPEDRDGSDDGSASTTTASASMSAERAAVLVVKDCDPWNETPNEDTLSALDVPYHVVGSREVSDERLASYAVVLLPSTQPQGYYDRLAGERSSLESYVADGGTLVAHTMYAGWPCNAGLDEAATYLPGGVRTEYTGRRDVNTIKRPSHPVVEDLSDADFQRPEVSYVELVDLPESADVVLSARDDEAVYVEYGYGDGTVLATGNPMEGGWAVAGHATPKRFLRNELRYAMSLGSAGREVSASVTTLQFIPGGNENGTEGGDPLRGGLMQLFSEDNFGVDIRGYSLEAKIYPVLDSWLKGDQTAVEGDVRPGDDELPQDLETARRKESGKYVDEFGTDAFGIYRFENGVNVSFETPDGERVDEESVEITFNESGRAPPDPAVSLEGRADPVSVTPDHGVNRLPVEEWHGSYAERSNRKPRHYEYQTDFEHDGVQGVRVLTIAGGYAGFVADWAERVGENPPAFLNEAWDWDLNETLAELAWLAAPPQKQFLADYLTVVPNTYSFIEFIVLADGRRYARVWDASQYPSLATYVDGTRESIEKMPYSPVERLNLWVTAFHVQASAGLTPYHSPLDLYGRLVDRNDRERFEAMLDDEIRQILEWLPPIGWGVGDFVPRIPRETFGFDADGDPLSDPEEPFDRDAGLLFPWSGTIEPA